MYVHSFISTHVRIFHFSLLDSQRMYAFSNMLFCLYPPSPMTVTPDVFSKVCVRCGRILTEDVMVSIEVIKHPCIQLCTVYGGLDDTHAHMHTRTHTCALVRVQHTHTHKHTHTQHIHGVFCSLVCYPLSSIAGDGLDFPLVSMYLLHTLTGMCMLVCIIRVLMYMYVYASLRFGIILERFSITFERYVIS